MPTVIGVRNKIIRFGEFTEEAKERLKNEKMMKI